LIPQTEYLHTLAKLATAAGIELFSICFKVRHLAAEQLSASVLHRINLYC